MSHNQCQIVEVFRKSTQQRLLSLSQITSFNSYHSWLLVKAPSQSSCFRKTTQFWSLWLKWIQHTNCLIEDCTPTIPKNPESAIIRTAQREGGETKPGMLTLSIQAGCQFTGYYSPELKSLGIIRWGNMNYERLDCFRTIKCSYLLSCLMLTFCP